jgi:hypothetical protein
MNVTVKIDGKTETVDATLDDLELDEWVSLQRRVGNDEYDDLLRGSVRPVSLQAILWIKLRRRHPDLTPDAISVNFLEAFADSVADDETVDPTETG